MDADAFKQMMVASIYPGLTEQVQTLLVEFLQGIGEVSWLIIFSIAKCVSS